MKASSKARSAARLAAVQALYQFDMEGTRLTQLLDEFHRHRLSAEIEGDQYAQAVVAFFDDVVQGVVARRDEIDELLSGKLAEGWRIERLDKTMLQILRAGAWELLARAARVRRSTCVSTRSGPSATSTASSSAAATPRARSPPPTASAAASSASASSPTSAPSA